MRGEVYRLRVPRGTRGHEQAGVRYAVVVQSDLLPLSTWLVAPTSTSARAATFRPEVLIDGCPTRVLAEQTSAVDPQRWGDPAGLLTFEELRRVDRASTTEVPFRSAPAGPGRPAVVRCPADTGPSRIL